jgi:flagellar hook assembly protein FlgD
MAFGKNALKIIIASSLMTAVALSCVEKQSDQCRPSISSCSGSPCTFYSVYNENNQFVAEGTSPGLTQILWDGKDCHGTAVPCGAYTVKMTLIYGGSSQTTTASLLVTGPDAKSVIGRKACDSLKTACTGHYHETVVTSYSDPFTLTTDIGCICCQ